MEAVEVVWRMPTECESVEKATELPELQNRSTVGFLLERGETVSVARDYDFADEEYLKVISIPAEHVLSINRLEPKEDKPKRNKKASSDQSTARKEVVRRDDEFKREIVRRIEIDGEKAVAISREIGVSQPVISGWRKKYKIANGEGLLEE